MDEPPEVNLLTRYHCAAALFHLLEAMAEG
jgi:hypothetical protein